MIERRVALFVMSVSSILVWDVLSLLNFLGGKMQTVLVGLSLVVLIYSCFKLINDFKFENNYFKFIFIIFLLYESIVILRGWSFSLNDIKTFIQVEYIFWPFVIPLFVFFNKKIETFGLLFKWIYYVGTFFIVIAVLVPTLLLRRLTAETYISLLVPCGFLLLNATYISNKKVNVSFLILFISMIALTYLARRSGFITLAGIVISAYFLNLFNKSKSKIFRLFPLIAIICFFFLFSQFFESSKELLLNKMIQRISEDTRTGVFDAFFYYLRDHMVFGNGMNSKYFCILWDAEVDGVFFKATQYRDIIENGYLQLLLSGGIVHIVIFLLVLLPAAFRGIFMSSNQFVKACGTVIILRLIDMFAFGIPALNLSYILVWICVGVCYKTSMCKMTNDEIRSEFKKINL